MSRDNTFMIEAICSYFQIEHDHCADLLSEFEGTIGQSQLQQDWFFTWDEDGSFEIDYFENLFFKYVETRLSEESVEHFREFRGAKSFADAKNEVIFALKCWRDQIAGSVQDARRFKKPKPRMK